MVILMVVDDYGGTEGWLNIISFLMSVILTLGSIILAIINWFINSPMLSSIVEIMALLIPWFVTLFVLSTVSGALGGVSSEVKS